MSELTTNRPSRPRPPKGTNRMSTSMQDRIYEASLLAIGYAYLDKVSAPWLSWPLMTLPLDEAEWLRDVVRLVVGSPVCQRTEEQAWAELAAINNPKLAKLLGRMEVAS